ncbi:hypothetical protein T440DRAFT_275622 [Plenodomus tracheiphilus IPT5]|uniref:Uncharacterized protein n=1 Tax=Plenodomus tracheiphilus IPT5 TaxID=1408161 RepID=A0A6A7BGA5_9PLEO|nr:hypothetical protein T440DRAFT_275622 [Plenodomus tracheiphilus IPT5]
MTCGYLPVYSPSFRDPYLNLKVRSFGVSEMDQMHQIFHMLELGVEELDILSKSLCHQDVAQRLPGFADILGLVLPWLPLGLSYAVDNPLPIALTPMGVRNEALAVWANYLGRQRCNVTGVKKRVLHFYDQWKDTLPPRRWPDCEHTRGTLGKVSEFEVLIKNIFDETTNYWIE